MSCQPQGQAETQSPEDQGPAAGTKHVRFLAEERGAEKAQREGAVPKLPKVKASRQQDASRQTTASSEEAGSSSSAESSLSAESQGAPCRLPHLARDSVPLLRRRAQKTGAVREEPEETAASTSHGESSLPEESSADTSGFLPPIEEETGPPRCQTPKTKAPPRRKGTPYPR